MNGSSTYKIKPLVWVKNGHNNSERYFNSNEFGEYEITRYWEEDHWGAWLLWHDFDGAGYDHGTITVDSIEDGKGKSMARLAKTCDGITQRNY